MSDKTARRTAVPKLRFPEFRDAGGWFNKSLESLLAYERPEKYIVSDIKKEKNGIPVLTANKSFILGYTDETDAIYNEIPVIIFDDFTTDKKYVDFPFKVKSSAIKILKNKEGHNLKLIFELMNKVRFNATNHKRYYISEYRKLFIFLPEEAEQQKIADCLASVDDLIAAEKEKLDAFQDHKKGLMQQLFPAEKESFPKIRFPEFRKTPKWEEKRLKEMCAKITQGGTPDTSNATFWNGSIEWLTPAEMGKIESRFIKSTVRKITQSGLQNCSSELLPINSIIISTRAPIGHLAINISEMSFNQGCKGLVPKETTNHDFLYYILCVSKVSLMNLGAGNTFKELSGSALKNFSAKFPQLEEQKKVASCLSSLDELIAIQSQKIRSLQNHKKGLMQQLLPSADEVAE